MRTGDVLVVRTTGPYGWLIRLGARLRGQPHQQDHVAIVVNEYGQTVQAMPDGVSLGHVDEYPARWTLTNAGQVKTDPQRQAVADLARSFLRTPYDWAAISADATNCFDLRDPFVPAWPPPPAVPSSFVCSALADYVYGKVGLLCPDGGRFTTPADWATFIYAHHYDRETTP